MMVSFMPFVFGSQEACAQDFPTKQITLVSPYGPGGGFDLAGRAIAAVAQDYLGQSVYVLLKPGGGGAVGSDYAAKAPPDGYTLFWASPGPNCTLPAIEGRSKGPDDFDSVCQMFLSPYLIMAHPSAPFKTFKEMIDWARANPGKLVFGTTGVWGIGDLAWKRIMKEAGITTRIVPYDGGGPAMVAGLGGHVQALANSSPVALPHILAGKVKPLACLDTKRHPKLPDVPTVKESGINVVTNMWAGIVAPKHTPRPVIEKLAAAFKKMSQDKSFIALYRQLDAEAVYLGPEEFAKFWREEFEIHKEIGRLFKK